MREQRSEGWGAKPRQPGSTDPHSDSFRSRPGVAPGEAGSPPAQANQPRQLKRQRPRQGCGPLLAGTLFGLGLALLVLTGALAGYVAIARDLPQPNELQARASQFASTLVYDRSGGLLYEAADREHGRRTVVSLQQISPYLIDGTIATEDPNFYRHAGVDPVGLVRALYYAIRAGDLAGPGGSTITQQLVKLTFLSPERTLSRKLREGILAAEITRRYPKDTVLQIYLNEIYYGNLAYGVQAAAETYFGKPAAELDLAEAALLAGLPQAPYYYDPYSRLWNADGRPGPVKARQGVVLAQMVKHGYITPGQADAAWAEPLSLIPVSNRSSARYPHFVQYAQQSVEEALGPELASKGGLQIYTTLDVALQEIAEEEVAKELSALAEQGAGNSAVVIIRPATGEVLAMVGSASFQDEKISGQINMALSPRQPGSAIKPLTYLAAFELSASEWTDPAGAPLPGVSAIEPPGYWTPATALMDITTQFPDGLNPPYVPGNFDGKEHGLVSVREALANSYNIPAVKALEHVGIERFKDLAARLGISTLVRADYGLSLTLGGGEVTLLELTGAYATLANRGVRAETSPVACVLDPSGQIIWQGRAVDAVPECAAAPRPATGLSATSGDLQSAVSEKHAYLITSILSDLEARRPMFGASAELLGLADRPAAAKTGTTNDFRDGWTLGYTPDLAVGVWVGNADYSPMSAVSGLRGAAPIWHNVMTRAHAGQPVHSFNEPAGIEHISVCSFGGALVGPACPAQREELFVAGQGPLPAVFDLHQRLLVDRLTGQLATAFTPQDRIETRDVVIFPEKYWLWAEAHGYPQLFLAGQAYSFTPELSLRSPVSGEQVTGFVAIVGSARVPEPLQWRLEYGVGPDPLGWGVLSELSTGELSGHLASWNADATRDSHQVADFSLRLAAYDPANGDYPVAVSNVVYVVVAAPIATPTASPTWTSNASPSPTATMPGSEATRPAPDATATPVPALTLEPATSPTPESQAVAILSPVDGDQVFGRVTIVGWAEVQNFSYYMVEFAAGEAPEPDAWRSVGAVQIAPVRNGFLADWDTAGLAPGLYTIRLTVVDALGSISISEARVELTPAPS